MQDQSRKAGSSVLTLQLGGLTLPLPPPHRGEQICPPPPSLASPAQLGDLGPAPTPSPSFVFSLKLECDKLASEKSEMQRHYVMVSHPRRAGGGPQTLLRHRQLLAAPPGHPGHVLWGVRGFRPRSPFSQPEATSLSWLPAQAVAEVPNPRVAAWACQVPGCPWQQRRQGCEGQERGGAAESLPAPGGLGIPALNPSAPSLGDEGSWGLTEAGG